jgi:hypothetical protein
MRNALFSGRGKIPDQASLLDTMTFASGANEPESGQMCVMEAAAYIAGEPWGDHPQCVSPVIAAFLRSWNDALPDETRTALLRPLLPLVIGTRTTDADEETRAWMATDWLVRVHTPAWLRLAGLTDHAQALESLARIADATVAGNAQRTIDAARDAAGYAARAAARDAAGDAIAPTVTMLQAAACDLVREMCAVGRVAAETCARSAPITAGDTQGERDEHAALSASADADTESMGAFMREMFGKYPNATRVDATPTPHAGGTDA